MCVEPLRKSYSGPVTYNTNFHQRYCHLASKKKKISKKIAMIGAKETLRWADQEMKLGNSKEVRW